MRYNASLSLFIVLVTIVMALLFYAFAGVIDPIRVIADGQSTVTVQSSSTNWSTVVSRLMIGGLLVFLVQTLARIYRYSIRMAAFYEGRADALMLFLQNSESKSSKLPDLVDVGDVVSWLAGDKVEFEKPPKAPTAHVASIVKAAVEAATKK